LNDAAESMSPAVIANHCYDIAKAYNSFYHECPILKESNDAKKAFRLQLNAETGKTLRYFMGLLGIEMPDRM
ncbi:MAG: arginine--tRNA ligase, partial [Bacteroidetes bacterium]|nr:arginine--tRNA ligase [Bacteroidota bacterium]